MTTLLSLENLSTGYGSGQVLFDIDLQIGVGEMATLLGRNGMGKTTTVRTIMGLQPCQAGTIRFRGEHIQNRRPQVIAQRGIALVPEGRQIFPNLTVRENLVAFAANRNGQTEPWTLERIYDLFPILRDRAHNMGRQLSGGEQQMLAIARILRTGARFILMDEPSEGLAPVIIEQIGETMKRLKKEGFTIILVEQNLQFASDFADRHYIIEQGTVAEEISNSELVNDMDKIRSYLSV